MISFPSRDFPKSSFLTAKEATSLYVLKLPRPYGLGSFHS